MKYGTILKELK